MASEIVSRLAAIRAMLGSSGTLTGSYLDCVLDKHDNRYRYETYIATSVLMPLISGSAPPLEAPELARLLVADAMRFELRALHAWHKVMPASRPPVRVVRKRLRLGVRFAASGSCVPEPARGQDDLLELAEQPERPETARRLLAALPEAADQDASIRIAVSVLPVDVFHDEYLFIRILQSYEAVFSGLTDHLREAVRSIRARNAGNVRSAIAAATESITQAGRLFSTLATMSADSFRRFRLFTEGASAIQSEQYKRLELLCGLPRAERLSSPAFDNVPTIQEDAYRNPDSLTHAYRQARKEEWFTSAEWVAIDGVLNDLERAHQRWKMAHFRIAEKMLGDARGSGYTAGVPYLKEVLDNRLFWGIPERAGRELGDDT